jgi:hypothetical protein
MEEQIPIEELKRVCRIAMKYATWEEKCLLLQWYIRLETGFWYPNFHTLPCSDMALFDKNYRIARAYFRTLE